MPRDASGGHLNEGILSCLEQSIEILMNARFKIEAILKRQGLCISLDCILFSIGRHLSIYYRTDMGLKAAYGPINFW